MYSFSIYSFSRMLAGLLSAFQLSKVDFVVKQNSKSPIQDGGLQAMCLQILLRKGWRSQH